MTIYKYLCTWCGYVDETFKFLGMKHICGKCRRESVLSGFVTDPKKPISDYSAWQLREI